MAALTRELRAWIQPGVAGVIAVADDARQPEIVRMWAVRAVDLADAPDILEAYALREAAARLLEIMGDGRRAALNVVEVSSYRSRLFKGFCTPLRGAVDQAFIDASVAAQSRAFTSVGMGPNAAERLLAHTPDREMIGFRLQVDCVFDQSPKPGAGAPL
jgi:hypothetical protein